jgi:hypothetical protein
VLLALGFLLADVFEDFGFVGEMRVRIRRRGPVEALPSILIS